MSRSARTIAAVAAHGDGRFEWGKNDCVQFVRRVVADVTGVNFAPELRYSSESESVDIVERFGGTIRTMITEIVGPESDASECEDGDPLLLTSYKGQMLGVKLGRLAVYKGVEGVRWLDLENAICGWRVRCLL